MQPLYPKISPNQTVMLDVGDGHSLYVECSGNKNGTPVVYLHGGPGGGSSEHFRRYFDPEKYFIVQFDQRGCGKSKPSPSIENNTLADLIADMEKIRRHFAIDKWLVTGGSWGTTLALAYGCQYPEKVHGFILRGIFLGTQMEYDWLYKASGAATFFPKYYRDFVDVLPPEQHDNPLTAYYRMLNSDNELQVIAACKEWYRWESRISSVEHSEKALSKISDPHQALCMAKISSHYFVNNSFLKQPLLSQLRAISNIPAIILHGRYDMVCQIYQADLLSRAWRNAQLQILPLAGHSGFEQQTIDAFCKAADTMANFIEELN